MNRKNTTEILKKLRSLMKNKFHNGCSIKGYIIPSGDSHQSEYIASCDERRAFVSGFNGSAGTAVVTENKAALWTDGRYFMQAEKQLDENWILMKQGLPDTPSKVKWLSQELAAGSIIGADPCLVDSQLWNEMLNELSLDGLTLVSIPENLIDKIWEDRPPRPSNIVFPLEKEFTGQTLSEKVENLREKLKEETASGIVLTALDEIAYIFNLRGSDINYNPVFFSYAIISLDEAFLFIDGTKLLPSAAAYLQEGSVKVKILPYENISKGIDDLVSSGTGKIMVSNHCSHAISEMIPTERKMSTISPVAIMKSVKNATEREGLRRCHIRDGAALCQYLCWLEKEAPKGNQTECSGADFLHNLRKQQENFVGLSFSTISSVGPNASIVHYSPTPGKDRMITTEEIYLVDSGAQYKDGTTDVTRTVHFGTPSDFEKESFTRVLKGHIALARCVFPSKLKGNYLDTIARQFLWEAGMDYSHGTGHGIGMYLNVHEGPMSVSWRPNKDDCGLEDGMFISNEPGFYEDGKFGIRIENIVEIEKANTCYNHKDKVFLKFNTITMAPIQTKLICKNMLTQEEVKWLNDYHTKVAETVGPFLLEQKYTEAFHWLVKETRPI